jgi:hypothetical protein
MSAPGPGKKPSGFSLYGDLLEPSKNSTITGAPVKYEMKKSEPETEVAAAKKKQDGRVAFSYFTRQ